MELLLGNPLFLHRLRLHPRPRPHPHPRALRSFHVATIAKTLNASTGSARSVYQSACAEPVCFRLRVNRDGSGRVLGYGGRTTNTSHQVTRTMLSGVEDTEVTSSQFEDFDVVNTSINEDRELKIGIKVSGGKTEAIFNQVFDRMVAAAQPIPGFRREKGGKTPNGKALPKGACLVFLLTIVVYFHKEKHLFYNHWIPKHILLEILGPSRVYKEVIKGIIDSTVAQFIEKNQLRVGRNLKVEQSFEDLEATFESGRALGFDAVLKLLD